MFATKALALNNRAAAVDPQRTLAVSENLRASHDHPTPTAAVLGDFWVMHYTSTMHFDRSVPLEAGCVYDGTTHWVDIPLNSADCSKASPGC